jgi:peptidoglycan hydrolase-like protein with peptidoglycan-binding domain
MRYEILAVYGCLRRARAAAIAISLCTLPAGVVASGRTIQLAQDASEAGRGAIEPNQAPAASAPANSPEQIRKAQVELRRLDCLKGRIDGKLGDQTREAVRKFWASAKQPVVEVNITDELIANLAGRGDNFCRPPRPFFGFGGRALPPLFAPGARPGSIPPTTVPSVSPDAVPDQR